MRGYKINDVFITVFFVMVLAGPLIFVNTNTEKISTAENRVLAKFPNINISDRECNPRYTKEIENWFNDNLGFRDQLLMSNTWLQYNLFGVIPLKNIVVGKNDWLYTIYPDMYENYQNLDMPTNERYLKYSQKFIQLKSYFQLRKIPFITMIVPAKYSIYPENMPDTIIKHNNMSKTNLVIEYLTETAHIDIFSPESALFQAKDKAIIYSQNYDSGSHWNDYGAFVGYLELMSRIKKYLPGTKILSFDDFTIKSNTRQREIYGVIPFVEEDYSFSHIKGYSAIQERGLLNNLNVMESHYAYRYVNPTDPTLPRALIIGDSFIHMFLLSNIAESFSEIVFVHWYNMGNVKNYVNVFKPDIFIFELYEAAMDEFTDCISYPEDYFVDYEIYKNLPTISNPVMWVDFCNNEKVQPQGKIIIDRSAKVVNIEGWALDSKIWNTAGDVYLRVGDKYYFGAYGLPRTHVSDYYKNTNLINSGFIFNIDSADLIDAGKFSFIIVSKDKAYQYAPVDYTVEVK